MNARVTILPSAATPVDRVLSTFDRSQLAGFIEVAIALLDLADGDADVEANGDELDGTAAEDDFYPHSNWLGAPGCPVSDPDMCPAHDDDPARSSSDGRAGDPDDAEDDDPAGDSLDEHGEHPTDNGTPMLSVKPTYGADQSTGPTNEQEAHHAWIQSFTSLPRRGAE